MAIRNIVKQGDSVLTKNADELKSSMTDFSSFWTI